MSQELTINFRRNGVFVEEKITNKHRKDYDMFLMGQTKLDYLVKIRRRSKHEITRIFDKLFYEKLHIHQTQQ